MQFASSNHGASKGQGTNGNANPPIVRSDDADDGKDGDDGVDSDSINA